MNGDGSGVSEFSGLNNVTDSSRLKPGELAVAENVDIDRTGGIHKRGGRVLRHAGNCRSVFGSKIGLMFAEGGSLQAMSPNNAVTTLATGVNPLKHVAFCEGIPGQIFWSDGVSTGVVTADGNRPWGITNPAPPTIAVSTGGGIPPGRYRAVAVFIASGGRVSGASLPSEVVEISESGASLVVSPPAFVGEAVAVEVFMSSGEAFFRVGLISPGGVLTVQTFVGSTPLGTEGVYPPPPGHIIRVFNGRIYIASGSVVWYSDPFAFEWFRLESNYFQFDSKVLMLEPTVDGLYVSADKTYFMSGTDPTEMSLMIADESKAIPGAATTVSASQLGLKDVPGKVPVWMAEGKGIMVGLPGGLLTDITKGRFASTGGDSGSAILRNYRGSNQLLTALSQRSRSDAVAARDTATAQVFRNGVEI